MNKKIYKIFLVFCVFLLLFSYKPVFGSTKSDIQKDVDVWKTYIASLPAQPNKLLEKQDTFLKKVQKWFAVGIAGRASSANWDRYNELYYNARTYENLAKQELTMAQVFLDKGMFKEAREHLEGTSSQSRKWNLYDQAANEVWLGNLEKAQQIEYEAGKTVNNAVGFVGKTVNKIAEKTGNSTIATIGKGLEYEATVLNFTLDWGYQGLSEATKNTIKDKAIDVFADAAVEEYLGVSGGIGSMVASGLHMAAGIVNLQNEIKTSVNASQETLMFVEKELANDSRLTKATIVKAQERLNKISITTITVSEDNDFQFSNSASLQQSENIISQPQTSISTQTSNNKKTVPSSSLVPIAQSEQTELMSIPQSLSVSPTFPSRFAVIAISSTEIKLTWKNDSTVSGTRIERKIGSQGFFEIPFFAELPSSVTSYIDKGLVLNTEYCYRVYAFNSQGMRSDGYSDEVCAWTSTPSPSCTSNWSCVTWSTCTNNQRVRTCTDINNCGVSTNKPALTQSCTVQPSYETINPHLSVTPTSGRKGTIFTLAGSGFTPGGSIKEIIYGSQVPDTIRYVTADQDGNYHSTYDSSSASLFNWTNVTYLIHAVDVTSGKSSNDAKGVSITITTPTNTATAPTVPSDCLATALSSSRISLVWQDNANNETGFKIERKSSGGTYAQINMNGILSGTGSGGYYEDSGLSAGTNYCYRVRAYNSIGDSDYSNETCASTQAAPVVQPTTTTGSATAITSNSATLNAIANPNGMATGVFFQWGISSSFGNTTPSQVIGSGNVNINVSANLTGLTPATVYYFRAVATNGSGGTVFGVIQTFTTNSAPTPTPALQPQITGISPNPVPAINARQWVTVNGKDFVFGLKIILRTGSEVYTIPITSAGWVNSTQVKIYPNFTVQPAQWTVQAVNLDNQQSNMFSFSVVASIINPQLLITPASGAKGTVFNYVGTGFTPNGGITEVIFKPDGTNYPSLYYSADGNGSFTKTYNSATASIMGTYTITWFDDTTGRQSNQVQETINAY